MSTNELVTLCIAGASLVVSIVGAFIAAASARTARQQLALVQRKIGMVTDPDRMTEVLPVWYVDRMGRDWWGFGLFLNSGEILGIGRIIGVSDDGHWLEVDLLERGSGPEDLCGVPVLYAALPERTRASVRVEQVQAAFELWTS